MTDITQIPWRLYAFPSKKPDPLINRIDQAVILYHERTKEIPNVAMISGPDWEEAQAIAHGKAVTVALPSGHKAHVELRLAPFGGTERRLYIGHMEVVQE